MPKTKARESLTFTDRRRWVETHQMKTCTDSSEWWHPELADCPKCGSDDVFVSFSPAVFPIVFCRKCPYYICELETDDAVKQWQKESSDANGNQD